MYNHAGAVVKMLYKSLTLTMQSFNNNTHQHATNDAAYKKLRTR